MRRSLAGPVALFVALSPSLPVPASADTRRSRRARLPESLLTIQPACRCESCVSPIWSHLIFSRAMDQPTSPGAEHPRRITRAIARLTLVVGTVAAFWLLAPASANADEGPLDDVAEAVDDVAQSTQDPVTDTASDVVESATVSDTTDAVEQVTAPEAARDGEPIQDVTAALTPGEVEHVAGEVLNGAQGAIQEARGVASPLVDAVDGLTPIASELIRSATDPVIALLAPTIQPGPTIESIGLPGPGSQDPAFSPLVQPIDSTGISRAFALANSAGQWLMADVSLEGTSTSSGGSASLPRDPNDEPSTTGSGARSGPRMSVDDLAAFLMLMAILLGLGRWSRREAELRLSPVFLSLAERPG